MRLRAGSVVESVPPQVISVINITSTRAEELISEITHCCCYFGGVNLHALSPRCTQSCNLHNEENAHKSRQF